MQPSHATRLLVIAAAIEFSTGVGLYAFPGDLPPAIYGPLLPYVARLSAALLAGGLLLLLLVRYRFAPAVRRTAAFLAALPLLLLAWYLPHSGGYTGATNYLFLAIGTILTPWVDQAKRGASLSLSTLTLGAIHTAIGALWIFQPHIFTSPAFQPIQPVLRLLGLISLLVGLVMIAPARTDRSAWARRVLGLGLPLILTITFLRTQAWTGVILWSLWAAGVLLEPYLILETKGERTERETPPDLEETWVRSVLPAVETWTWALTLLVVLLTTVLGPSATESMPRAFLFVLLLAGYNITVYWVLPPIGTPRARIHVHLVVLAISVGVLLSGATPVSGALLPLFLAIPMVAARTSGRRWGYGILAFVLLVLIISALVDAWIDARAASRIFVTLTIQVLILAATGVVGVLAAAERRRTYRRLHSTTRDLDRQLQQLRLVDQIGRAVRSTLDLRATLLTTVQELGVALDAQHGFIQLEGEGLTYTYCDSGDEELHRLTPAQEQGLQQAKDESRIVTRYDEDSFLAAPITTDSAQLGIVTFLRRAPGGPWQPEELHFLSAVVGQVAVALVHAETHEALARQHAELESANQLLAAQGEELAAQQEELISQHEKVLEQSAVLRAQRDALQESESRFRTSFEGAPIGMALLNLDLVILQANQALAEMMGVEPPALQGQALAQLAAPEYFRKQRRLVAEVLEGIRDRYQLECPFFHREGRLVWVSVSSAAVRDARGETLYLIAQMMDITERRQSEEQLQRLANYDQLTDLLNRHRFEQEVEQYLEPASHEQGQGALLFLDFDQFKYVNDSLGHRAGDQLLRGLARVIQGSVAGRGPVARLGGDEFAIYLPNADVELAEALATSLLLAVRQHIDVVAGEQVGMTVSIGIALYPEHGHTVEDLMLHGDLAMYQAKAGGRNRHRVYTADQVEVEMGSKLNWERRIREALAEDRFVLHFQPILELGTETVDEYEALLRLQEPSGALISPRQFLGVAESYGLIHAVDRWVVHQAIQTIAEQRRKGRQIGLAVNLSAKAFADSELLPWIQAELTRHDVNPSALTFEITETAAVADIQTATQFIQTLTAMGCRFALDDFGAGLSSLYYLKSLPVSCLKIDGTFIERLPSEPVDQKMVRAVVTLARELGMRTVAEYVGSDDTVALLRSYGVDAAQGYHVGRPGPLPE